MVVFGDLITELALWLTIALLLFVVGFSWSQWQFWALAMTYWAVSTIARKQGTLEGVINYLNLPLADQEKIRRTVNKIQKDMDS